MGWRYPGAGDEERLRVSNKDLATQHRIYKIGRYLAVSKGDTYSLY